MKPAIVAAIQPKWQRFEDEPALRNHLARFLRMARDKGATVAVLPELSGLMLAAPLGREVTMAANRNSFGDDYAARSAGRRNWPICSRRSSTSRATCSWSDTLPFSAAWRGNLRW